MKGFSVEPGERSACGHVDLAGALGIKIIGGTDPRQHVAGGIAPRPGSRREISGPSVFAPLARKLLEARLPRPINGKLDT